MGQRPAQPKGQASEPTGGQGLDPTSITNKVSEADKLLDELTAKPQPRVYSKEKDIDKYLTDRADKLRAAVAAGNTFVTLARGLRDTFGDVSEKTISRKISALVGTPKSSRRGSKKRTTTSPGKVMISTPDKGNPDGAAKVEPTAQPKTARVTKPSAHLRTDDGDL